MNSVSPEIVLEQLKIEASTRVKNSLDAIYLICNEQIKRGLHEFGYATIARLGKGRGVPTAQSIRNKTGEPYRTLIKSFVDLHGKQEITKKRPTIGKGSAWIDEIKDPVLKLQVSILHAEKVQAEQLVKNIVPIDQRIEIYDGLSALGSQRKFTDLEREALEYILSNEFMRREQLEPSKNGSIVRCDNKELFFPVATLDALNKALGNL
jgi:hypothetical protein